MGLFDGLFDGSSDPASTAPTVPAVPANPVPANASNPLPGFLSGLMGQQQGAGGSNLTGNVLTALGQSLIFSPSNDPLKGFGAAVNKQTGASNADAQRQRMISALRAAGKSDAEIQAILAGQQSTGIPGALGLSSGGLMGSLFGGSASPSDASAMPQPGTPEARNIHF